MKKNDKNKKNSGCLRYFIKALVVFVFFLATAVFFGHKYIRPLISDRLTHFDPEVFGFEIPEGFSSRALPLPAAAGDFNFAVLNGVADASEILDRISLNAARGGWKPENLSLSDMDFDFKKVKDIVNKNPESPVETIFFRKKEKFLFLSSFLGGENVYLIAVTGDAVKLFSNEK